MVWLADRGEQIDRQREEGGLLLENLVARHMEVAGGEGRCQAPDVRAAELEHHIDE